MVNKNWTKAGFTGNVTGILCPLQRVKTFKGLKIGGRRIARGLNNHMSPNTTEGKQIVLESNQHWLLSTSSVTERSLHLTHSF